MNTLILDCSAGMSVYVLAGKEVFSKIDLSQKKHTDELLVAVDNLLAEAKIGTKELDNVCVCIGPGSFTGIRVAVSIAKGLAIGCNAKVFVCSNFDIFSFGETSKTIYFLEAFSNYIYIRKFDGKNCNDNCINLNDIKSEIKDGYRIVACSEKTQNILKNYEINSIIAKNCIIDAFIEKINLNEFTPLNEISPIYLRASQAEIEREKKLKGQPNG